MANPRYIYATLRRRRNDLPMLFEAALWLAVSRLALRLLEFQRVVKLITAVGRPALEVSEGEATAARVGCLVRTAARFVPWRAMCFEQGIAAQRMLMRRGFAADLVYGVASPVQGTIEAHVWIVLGERTIVGGMPTNRFTPIVVFRPGVGAIGPQMSQDSLQRGVKNSWQFPVKRG